LRTLKNYVRNKYRPEGAIAEGHLAEDCMTFCCKYLPDIETKQNRLNRNFDSSNKDSNVLSIFKCCGKPLSGGSWENMSDLKIKQAHFTSSKIVRKFVLGLSKTPFTYFTFKKK